VLIRVFTIVLAMAVSLALSVASSWASCMLDERPIEQQVIEATGPVFVGTVLDVRHDTTARFQVEEVWVGDVGSEVVVLGGPDEAGMATSVDRTWRVGTTYLVLTHVVDGRLMDNSCSSTQEWDEALAAARPASATAPTSGSSSDGGLSTGLVVAVAIGVLVLAVGATAALVRPRDAA
jgi:hypothetical protein